MKKKQNKQKRKGYKTLKVEMKKIGDHKDLITSEEIDAQVELKKMERLELQEQISNGTLQPGGTAEFFGEW